MCQAQVEADDVGFGDKFVEGNVGGIAGFGFRKRMPVVVLDFHTESACTFGNFLEDVRNYHDGRTDLIYPSNPAHPYDSEEFVLRIVAWIEFTPPFPYAELVTENSRSELECFPYLF